MGAVSTVGDALFDGIAGAVARMREGHLDEYVTLAGYFVAIDTMSRAGLIGWDEYIELRDLYWAMQYQPEPELIEPRTAA